MPSTIQIGVRKTARRLIFFSIPAAAFTIFVIYSKTIYRQIENDYVRMGRVKGCRAGAGNLLRRNSDR